MGNDVFETLGLMAFGGLIAWVLSLLVAYWRAQGIPQDPTSEKPPRRLWRGELRIVHRHVHELTEETVGLVGAMLDRAVQDYYTRQREHTENLPPARHVPMPPEPEERIARDLHKARAVLKGAEQIRAEAKARGLTIPMQDAMEEAARMVSAAYDDTYRG